MDTSILHTRIAEYKEKAKHPTSKEMILLFENWFLAIENYISEVEMDNFQLSKEVDKMRDTIRLLCDLLIITGHADKLILININEASTKKAINMLLKSKDRKNYDSIYAIALLIELFPEATNLKQLKELATRQ